MQMYDDDAEDITAAEWAALELQERHQLEEKMLKADPGYVEFLRSTYSEHIRSN
jgi:hypothetical protein